MRKIIFTMVMAGCMVAGLNAQALKVDAEGDVGIQTADPRFPLDINLNTPNNPTAQFGYFGIQSFDNTNGFLTANGFWNGANMESFNAGKMALLQFINAKVLFRTTPSVAAGGTTGVLFNNIVATNDGAAPQVGINEANPTETFHVAGNALKTDGGNLWAVPSDERLKTNVNDFTDGLEQVLQIRPVTFEYNGKGGTTKGEQSVGILAQEIQQIAPNMVSNYSYVKSASSGIGFEDDNSRAEKEDFLKYNGNALQYMLVNAIKQQQEIIEEKDAQIEDLENRFLELEKAITELKIGNASGTINKSSVDLRGYDLAELNQNVPNPFNGTTRIDYIIPVDASSAQIDIYSLKGRLLKTVQIDHTGEGQLSVNVHELPSGTYTYQLVVDGNNVESKKMILAN